MGMSKEALGTLKVLQVLNEKLDVCLTTLKQIGQRLDKIEKGLAATLNNDKVNSNKQ